MKNHHAYYQNTDLRWIELSIDFDKNIERIDKLNFSGSLVEAYQNELTELSLKVEGSLIESAMKLSSRDFQNIKKLANGEKAFTSLGLWLLHQAINDYFGRGRSLASQENLICHCYGVSREDLKTNLISRIDYDLEIIIAETKATSACGTCTAKIVRELKKIREDHGLVKGFKDARTRVDKDGNWIKINNMYPAELLIKLEELKIQWMIRENLVDLYKIEIVELEGHHVDLAVVSLLVGKSDNSETLIKALSEYWKSEIGAHFFLHLAN